MKTIKTIPIVWIIVMFLATFTSMLVYLVAQQTVRLGANESPAEAAADTSIKLQGGQDVNTAIPGSKTDISNSLSTFVMVYDSNKNLVASSGMFGSSLPEYPKGVFDTVDSKGEARVTWQPDRGHRFASVAIKYTGGYIVGARSLHEADKLISTVGKLVLLAWLLFAGISTLAAISAYEFMKKSRESGK